MVQYKKAPSKLAPRLSFAQRTRNQMPHMDWGHMLRMDHGMGGIDPRTAP